MKNVLLITVDSLRADYVFGAKAPDSLENIPKLINEGLAFRNAFSNAAYTKASFLSIMSGTYPWMFDAVQGGYGPDRPHIAELLSDAGYATAGFHTNVYLSPTYNYDRGFEYYLGRDSTASEQTTVRVETAYNWARAAGNKLVGRSLAISGVSDVIHHVYSTVGKRLGIQLGSHLYRPAEQLNDAVVDWARDCPQPAFIWVHYMDVHNPYYPHEGTVSEDISQRKAVKLYHNANELRGDTDESDLEALERLYRGEIEYFDEQLGDLLNQLDGCIDLDNTVIAFTSDHGEAFNEHGHVFHPGNALYEENVHIPFVLDGPGIGPGEVDTPVSNVDILPTLLSNVGLDSPPSAVGNDVTKFVTRTPRDRRVFAEAWSMEDGYVMVTDGKHKLIRNVETNDEELYVRQGPFSEVHSPSNEHPKIRDALGKALDDHIRSVSRSHRGQERIEVPEEVRLRLRKLGYDE